MGSHCTAEQGEKIWKIYRPLACLGFIALTVYLITRSGNAEMRMPLPLAGCEGERRGDRAPRYCRQASDATQAIIWQWTYDSDRLPVWETPCAC